MDSASLYDHDIETWAELQVAALKRLATRPGPWSNVIDWDNVIEEIESLGRERRGAVESLLGLVFVHLLQLFTEPHSMAAEHWKGEIRAFLKRARSKGARSMRSRVDLDALWRESLADAEKKLSGFQKSLPSETPRQCPFTFEELIDDGFDLLADRRLGGGHRGWED